MKPRSIGLATITSDLAEGDFLYDKLLEVVKEIPHEKFGYFSVYSTEVAEDLEIVAEGPEDGFEAVERTLLELGYTLTETQDIVNAIHNAGVIFRKVES